MPRDLNSKLFVTAGMPLAFDLSLLPKAERESIEPIITKRGGLVDANTGQFTCLLAPKSGHNAPENSVVQEYVLECARKNRLVDMNEYRPRTIPVQLHSASRNQSPLAVPKSAGKQKKKAAVTEPPSTRSSRKENTPRKDKNTKKKKTAHDSVSTESGSDADVFTEGARKRRKTNGTTQRRKNESSEEDGSESESEEQGTKRVLREKTKIQGKKPKPPPLRAPYTEEEDQTIIDSIVAYHRKGGSYKLTGDQLYRRIQKSIPHRSWQSIKERVKKYIRQRVDKALRAVDRDEIKLSASKKKTPIRVKKFSGRIQTERRGSDQSDDEGSEGGDEASDVDSGDKRSGQTPTKNEEEEEDAWMECAECSTDKEEGGVQCAHCCLWYHVGCVDAPEIIPPAWVCPRCVSHRQAPGTSGSRRAEHRQTSGRVDARDELPYAGRDEAPELDLFGDGGQSQAWASQHAHTGRGVSTEQHSRHTRPHEDNSDEEGRAQLRKKKRTETTESEVVQGQRGKRKKARLYSSSDTEKEKGNDSERRQGKERENEKDVEEEGRHSAADSERERPKGRGAQKRAAGGEDVGREKQAKKQRRQKKDGDGDLEEIDRMLLQAAGVPPQEALHSAAPTSPTQTQYDPSQHPADHASPPPFATQMESDNAGAPSDAAALAAFIQSVSTTMHLPRAIIIKALYWSSGSPRACLAYLQGSDTAELWDADADRQLLGAEVPPSDLVEKFGMEGINKRIVFLES